MSKVSSKSRKPKSSKQPAAPKNAAVNAEKNTIKIFDQKWRLEIMQPLPLAADGTRSLSRIWKDERMMLISPSVPPAERPMMAIRLFFDALRMEGALTYAASSSQGREAGVNMDAFDGYMQLRDCILENCPSDDPIRRDVRSIVEMGESGIDLKDLVEDMDELMKAFCALPAKRRKEIANGWVLPTRTVQLDRKTVQEALIGSELRSVYQINGGLPCGVDEPLDGEFSWEFNSSGQPIRISFRPGMRKMEVLDGIRALANRLEKQWETIIANPERRDVDELIAADIEREKE